MAVMPAGLVSTVANAAASAGLATQVGAAVGVAAVTAAAVTSGGMLNPAMAPAAAPAAFNNTNQSLALSPDDPWNPPVCSTPADTKKGYVELQIQELSEDIILEHRLEMQSLFREVYNNISGMCKCQLSGVLA